MATRPSVTTDGVVTTYTYNGDGTPNTQTRLGVVRTYTYSGGQLVSVT
jgi:YD repeat-containing protein